MKVLCALSLCLLMLSGCGYTKHVGSAYPNLPKKSTPYQASPAKNNTGETAETFKLHFGTSQPAASLCPREQTAAATLDSDKDGIADVWDECPATPGSLAVDATGCPLSLFLSFSLPFQSNQTNVPPEDSQKINQLGLLLKNNPHAKLTLAGHTDNSGTPQKNLQLSQIRADNLKQTLVVAYGIAPDRIVAQGFGDTRPLVSNQTETGRQRNRRIEITVSGYYSSQTSYVTLHRPYTVHFAANQTELDENLLKKISVLGDYLLRHPGVAADISGYTDSSGNEKLNLTLSVLRAEEIKHYLTETYGIAPERLQAQGYGQSNPIADNATESGRYRNRRVTITLNKFDRPARMANHFAPASVPQQAINTANAPLPKRFEIRFAPNNSQLQPNAAPAVDAIGNLMRSRPNMHVVIEGHASGQQEMENRRVSQHRAQHVKQYLQRRYGIDSSRLRTIGYGSDMTTANAEKADRVHIRLDRF